MPCTPEHPCMNPILRWVHSDKCRADTSAERIRQLMQKIHDLTKERDDAQRDATAWRRDFEAELEGNAELRARFGARSDETMTMFHERTARRIEKIEKACNDLVKGWESMAQLPGSENDWNAGAVAARHNSAAELKSALREADA